MSLSEEVEMLEESYRNARIDLDGLFALCYLIVNGGDKERDQSIKDLGALIPIIQKRHSFFFPGTSGKPQSSGEVSEWP